MKVSIVSVDAIPKLPASGGRRLKYTALYEQAMALPPKQALCLQCEDLAEAARISRAMRLKGRDRRTNYPGLKIVLRGATLYLTPSEE